MTADSKSVIHDLFGPLGQYMEVVVTQCDGAVGKLSAAPRLIQLYVYENSKDTPFILDAQQYRSQTKIISGKFVNAVIGCSDHLRSLDVSVTSGTFARVNLRKILTILRERGAFVRSQQATAEGEEATFSYTVSSDAIQKVEDMLLVQRDESIKEFIRAAIEILKNPKQKLLDESTSLAFYIEALTSLMTEQFQISSRRGSNGNMIEKILKKLASATIEDLRVFDLYFTVDSEENPSVAISSTTFSSVLNSKDLSKFHINVKNVSTDNPAIWTAEKLQRGGDTSRTPLWTLGLPLLETTDLLRNISDNSLSGATDLTVLRKMAAGVFYKDQDYSGLAIKYGNGSPDPLSISYEAWMKYIACADKPTDIFKSTRSASNVPDFDLTHDFWVRRTDGSFEKKDKLNGSYKVLSKEECGSLLNCASSLVSAGQCEDFMKAVIRGDISALKGYLDSQDFSWDRAENDLNEMNPNVVIKILTAFGFGPYKNSFGTGEVMCSVDDWLKHADTRKRFSIESTKGLNSKLLEYLGLLVQFVNHNKSLLNANLQKPGKIDVPSEVSELNVYNGFAEFNTSKDACSGPINWGLIRDATALGTANIGNITSYDPTDLRGFFNGFPGASLPTTGYMAMGMSGTGSLYGGGKGFKETIIFSQQGGTVTSFSNDIKRQFDSILLSLKQANKSLNEDELVALNKKIEQFTKLEQDLYEVICKLNRFKECLSMCGDNTPSTIILRDLDETVQQYKNTGTKYNTSNDCLQNLCYQLTQLLKQNTSNGSREFRPL